MRQDLVLQKLVGLEEGVREEAKVWRSLEQLAKAPGALETLEKETRTASRRLLQALPQRSLGPEGFASIFIDGTLLEGSDRREGTTVLRDKGRGLLWAVSFVGPVPVYGNYDRSLSDGFWGTLTSRGLHLLIGTMLGRQNDWVVGTPEQYLMPANYLPRGWGKTLKPERIVASRHTQFFRKDPIVEQIEGFLCEGRS